MVISLIFIVRHCCLDQRQSGYIKYTTINASMKIKKAHIYQKWLVGLDLTAMISSWIFPQMFGPFCFLTLFSKRRLLGGGGSIPQTVPVSTEISLIPGFSFIWVKCISSSSPCRERQFDWGEKKTSGYDMKNWCKRIKGQHFNCSNRIST